LIQSLKYDNFRFEVDEVVLFYPNTFNHERLDNSELVRADELAIGKDVKIRSFELPIINFALFQENHGVKPTINLDFEGLKMI
jgi:5-methylcytosine-specific restriction enzyme subunit McrC